MPEALVFYVLGGLGLVASALVIGQRNPMHSVLLLIVSFAALAGLYVQLDAPFVAVAQIIIYAGAIMVLFLFVVMLLNAPHEMGLAGDLLHHPIRQPGIIKIGGALAVLLVVQLSWALLRARELAVPVAATGDADEISSVRTLGRVLFTDYMFAFEATSILILVAMVGAVILAQRQEEK
jgi:NADH-quinone oxidoreductase subunit J